MASTLRTHIATNNERAWAIASRTVFHKNMRFMALFIRHLPTLMPLLFARSGSNLRRLICARPEIYWIVLTSFMAASWDCRGRVARLVDHFKTVTEVGGIVDFPPNLIVDLVHLAPIDRRYRITLDQAYWLLREGPLVLSLWDGVDRVFHVSFCLSTERGRRIAYVGSVQGRREVDRHNYRVDVLNSYRRFTKAAAGMRPRDFLIETFKMFCRAIGVSEIRAVSKLNHSFLESVTEFKLPYDEIWRERGGYRLDDGFFVLPVAAHRRSRAEMPTRKRAMYVKRYSQLDALEADLRAAVLHGGSANLVPSADE